MRTGTVGAEPTGPATGERLWPRAAPAGPGEASQGRRGATALVRAGNAPAATAPVPPRTAEGSEDRRAPRRRRRAGALPGGGFSRVDGQSAEEGLLQVLGSGPCGHWLIGGTGTSWDRTRARATTRAEGQQEGRCRPRSVRPAVPTRDATSAVPASQIQTFSVSTMVRLRAGSKQGACHPARVVSPSSLVTAAQRWLAQCSRADARGRHTSSGLARV